MNETRRDFLRFSLAGVGGLTLVANMSASPLRPETFHFDHVIGTSLDGLAMADDAAFERMHAEIDRLSAIFSLYDPDSEISRFNASGVAPRSLDFSIVLGLTQFWSRETQGALAARMTPSTPLNLNAVAKGYILQNAARVLQDSSPDFGFLNLGGDLTVWGDRPIAVGVADPFVKADNARPITAIRLLNQSVATSGVSMRGSHIFDPRTGQPATAIAQATVIAPQSTTANALATAMCVMRPEDAVHLADSLHDVACLIVPARGPAVRSARFPSHELKLEPISLRLDNAWPADHQVTVSIELPKVDQGRRYRKPYVAVWIENGEGKIVRTVTVWGNAPRWLPELSGWWKLAKDDRDLVKAVTKATRGPGKYEIVWDGKDDAGKAMPQGSYTVKVEVHREHGKHLFQTGKIKCEADAATVTLEKNAESEAVTIKYGKKGDGEAKP